MMLMELPAGASSTRPRASRGGGRTTSACAPSTMQARRGGPPRRRRRSPSSTCPRRCRRPTSWRSRVRHLCCCRTSPLRTWGRDSAVASRPTRCGTRGTSNCSGMTRRRAGSRAPRTSARSAGMCPRTGGHRRCASAASSRAGRTSSRSALFPTSGPGPGASPRRPSPRTVRPQSGLLRSRSRAAAPTTPSASTSGWPCPSRTGGPSPPWTCATPARASGPSPGRGGGTWTRCRAWTATGRRRACRSPATRRSPG
mmetsp:Transcript_42992/g.121662  ORF Transcript_42992/g.121662 Transcript_42992/m.121662 type:complete len:255 (-) Transcript_42992:58-822(-)